MQKEERNRRHQEIGKCAIDRRKHIDQPLVNIARILVRRRRAEREACPVCGNRQTSEKVEQVKREAGDDNVDDGTVDDPIKFFA